MEAVNSNYLDIRKSISGNGQGSEQLRSLNFVMYGKNIEFLCYTQVLVAPFVSICLCYPRVYVVLTLDFALSVYHCSDIVDH